jgi:heterodisulfide reductase subunit C2
MPHSRFFRLRGIPEGNIVTMKLAENPSLCYQCAKCSTGCPVSSEMDLLPHQIIHLLGLGQRDRALAAKTLWMCAGCYSCAVRCPNDIDITSVMDDLRSEAAARGLPCPNPEVLEFHRNFLKDLSPAAARYMSSG